MVDRELLRNDHPRIDFRGRYPCNVIGAQSIPPPNVPAEYSAQFNFEVLRHFHLSSDGQLTFLRYSFPYYDDLAPQTINIRFRGNFAAEFEHIPDGPKLTVPFVDGVIIEDSTHWDVEEKPLNAVVTRPIAGGLLVNMFVGLSDISAFLPRSFVPEHLRHDLPSLADTELQCEIFLVDTTRRNVVVRPLGWP